MNAVRGSIYGRYLVATYEEVVKFSMLIGISGRARLGKCLRNKEREEAKGRKSGKKAMVFISKIKVNLFVRKLFHSSN